MTALRTGSATWFELLTTREQLARALHILARSGQVQLESHGELAAEHLLPALRGMIDQYRQLLQRCEAFWPAAVAKDPGSERELEVIGRSALERLQSWAAAAEPTIRQVQQLASARAEMELLRDVLANTPAQLEVPNLALLSQAGPILSARAYRLKTGVQPLPIPHGVLTERIETTGDTYLIALGPSASVGALDEGLLALAARRIALPTWLPALRADALKELTVRLERIAGESSRLVAELDRLSNTHGVPDARADLGFIDWLVQQVPDLTMTENFAWITGWTSEPSGSAISSALTRAGLGFLVRFPTAPLGISPPVLLRNPGWARPFELFARLLGMPGASATDPTVLLVVLAPLLFGFMFGDVGQGAVVLTAGLVMRRRLPALALLVPGGMAAMGFGALFGSLFAREDLIPALWLKPLGHPLALLGVSLALGGAILLLGLGMEALQYHWAGQMRRWWSSRAGLVLAYLAVVASPFSIRTLWALPAGLACCLAGSLQRGEWMKAVAAAAESFEKLLQLLINTLSFLRVGAFALAHAGLASAVVALAMGARSPLLYGLVLLVGNVAMVALETLVVGIQTTRLVLFEFFIRFLHTSGRPFRPLTLPDSSRST